MFALGSSTERKGKEPQGSEPDRAERESLEAESPDEATSLGSAEAVAPGPPSGGRRSRRTSDSQEIGDTEQRPQLKRTGPEKPGAACSESYSGPPRVVLRVSTAGDTPAPPGTAKATRGLLASCFAFLLRGTPPHPRAQRKLLGASSRRASRFYCGGHPRTPGHSVPGPEPGASHPPDSDNPPPIRASLRLRRDHPPLVSQSAGRVAAWATTRSCPGSTSASAKR
jgi:hypothetical protein